MPGKSFVERPGSPSAQFQTYLQKMIVANGDSLGVTIVDLAAYLRKAYAENEQNGWFHPNDGHLTPAGHRVVADFLAAQLKSAIRF